MATLLQRAGWSVADDASLSLPWGGEKTRKAFSPPTFLVSCLMSMLQSSSKLLFDTHVKHGD
jgi:hypothetical protein